MKTWFMAGTSKGFGRECAEAALQHGDRVVDRLDTWPAWQPLALAAFGREGEQ